MIRLKYSIFLRIPFTPPPLGLLVGQHKQQSQIPFPLQSPLFDGDPRHSLLSSSQTEIPISMFPCS
ncbi:hypothetical protein Taro_008716 [Colocasia esculenta]|uniref:Uncharacterized protein n=1 Tax=Colocasia esculenta TaxID=4460 RepID=A0A843TY06_COLES|nr:hypothetical protein [Colocasia esculenta]